MLEVLHELIDAVAALRAITGNRQAELHAKLDQADQVDPAATRNDLPVIEQAAEAERGPFEPKLKSADVPPGA